VRVTEVSSQGEDVDDRDTKGKRGTKSAGDRAWECRAIIGAGAMYEFGGHARYQAETSRVERWGKKMIIPRHESRGVKIHGGKATGHRGIVDATGITMRTDTMDYMDGCKREQYTDMITSTGIEADEAESLWAYKRWRFSVVAHAAYMLALQQSNIFVCVHGRHLNAS